VRRPATAPGPLRPARPAPPCSRSSRRRGATSAGLRSAGGALPPAAVGRGASWGGRRDAVRCHRHRAREAHGPRRRGEPSGCVARRCRAEAGRAGGAAVRAGGSRGGVWGPPRRAGVALPRERQGRERAETQHVRLAPRGDQGAVVTCAPARHGVAVAARPQRGAPGVEGRGGGLELVACTCGGSSRQAAPSMVGLRPVDLPTGRKGGVGRPWPASAPSGCESGDQGQASCRSAQALEGAGSAAAPAYALAHASPPAEAKLSAKASGAAAGIFVLRGCRFRLVLTATCQGWTGSRKAGQSTYY